MLSSFKQICRRQLIACGKRHWTANGRLYSIFKLEVPCWKMDKDTNISTVSRLLNYSPGFFQKLWTDKYSPCHFNISARSEDMEKANKGGQGLAKRGTPQRWKTGLMFRVFQTGLERVSPKSFLLDYYNVGIWQLYCGIASSNEIFLGNLSTCSHSF